MTSVANEAMERVLSISFKPGSDGNVFATAFVGRVLRIFDIRCNSPLGEYSSLLRQITFTILNNSTLTFLWYKLSDGDNNEFFFFFIVSISIWSEESVLPFEVGHVFAIGLVTHRRCW